MPTMLPAGSFQGRTVLITGGGTGLGFAMAQEFGALGGNLVIASRKEEHLGPAQEKLAAAGVPCLAVPTDVRDVDAVDRLVAVARERFGGIDVLVNNAAGNFVVMAEDLSPNGWKAVTGIVLDGTFLMSRAVAKQMIERGKGGAILNIIATYAWTGGPGTAHSAAAKAGVWNLTMSLGVEWARYGIRVNAIAPGPISTEGTDKNLWPTEELRELVKGTVPLGRFGRPEEIAHAATYLCSDYASYVTGATLAVDGGAWLHKGIFGAKL